MSDSWRIFIIAFALYRIPDGELRRGAPIKRAVGFVRLSLCNPGCFELSFVPKVYCPEIGYQKFVIEVILSFVCGTICISLNLLNLFHFYEQESSLATYIEFTMSDEYGNAFAEKGSWNRWEERKSR